MHKTERNKAFFDSVPGQARLVRRGSRLAGAQHPVVDALACGILGALATYNSAFNQWPLQGVAALWKRHPHRRILSRKVKVRV
ncbi:hypothetical protein GCM10009527_033280 [Actinomadura nitritigenes]